jgi:hypothetical protein
MNEYTVAGVSRLDGQLKVRFANEIEYAEKLAKKGNVDIKLFEAPHAMQRVEIVEWLKTLPIYEDPETKTTIDEKLAWYIVKNKFSEKVKSKKVKVTTTKVKTAETPENVLAELTARAESMSN